MVYEKQDWNNGDPSTPLSAVRLRHMEDGIADALTIDDPELTAKIEEAVTGVKLGSFRAALAGRAFKPLDVVCLGDSVTEHAFVTAHDKTWARRLAGKIRERYPVAGVAGGVGFISPIVKGGVTAFTWPGTEFGPAAVGSPNGSPKRGLRAYPVGGGVTYNVKGTAIDIVGRKGSGTRVLTCSVDGGPAADVVLSGAATTYGEKVRVSLGASGAHTVTITAKAGNTSNPNFSGIIVYDGDESAGIRVHEVGWYGSTVNSWIDGVTAPATNWPADFQALTPDLVIISLGYNDRNFDYAPATYASNLTRLIGMLRATQTKPFGVVLQMYATPAIAASTPWSEYIKAARGVAALDPFTVVLDQTKLMPAVVAGSTYYVDGTGHLTDAGADKVADGVLQSIAPLLD